MKDTPKIVILGAGMSAVACAENLIDSFQVELYEKSKGVGGRLCSKKYNGTRYHLGLNFVLIPILNLKIFYLKIIQKNLVVMFLIALKEKLLRPTNTSFMLMVCRAY